MSKSTIHSKKTGYKRFATWAQFHQHIYARRSQKHKKTDDLTVFFTLMGSASVKDVCRTLMKLIPVDFWAMHWWFYNGWPHLCHISYIRHILRRAQPGPPNLSHRYVRRVCTRPEDFAYRGKTHFKNQFYTDFVFACRLYPRKNLGTTKKSVEN